MDVANREQEGRVSLGERVSRHPIAAGAAAGFLLWSAFPPLEWSLLAWVALMPLFRLAVEPTSRRSIYVGAWVGGLVFWAASLQWVRLTDPTAWTAWATMALIFSLWWPGFLAITRYAVFSLGVPLLLAAPILWVGLEHVRAFLLSGFPWYYLGHSQYQAIPLIQIADATGALGLSLLIAAVNALIVDLMTLPLLYQTAAGSRLRPRQAIRLWIVGLALVGTLSYGFYRLSTSRFEPGPRLALLQTNFEQRYKTYADPLEILSRIEGLALRSVTREPKPDLLVWPETSYPYPLVELDPALDDVELQGQLDLLWDQIRVPDWREIKARRDEYLHAMTDAVRVPMLVGSLRYVHRPDGHRKFNSAVLATPGSQALQTYNKIQLVPFGEYIPLFDALPWLTVFTPYRDGYVPSLTFGEETNLLELGDHRLAVGICFEDTVPHLIRRFFSDAPEGRQPDVLIDLSNDGWFHGSSELDMHLAVSVFRAVENRVPLARAVNTGLSAIIDGDGRILRTLPRMTEGVLEDQIPLDPRTSLYTQWGDWLGFSCLAVCLGIVPTGLVYTRWKARRAIAG